MVPNRLVDVWKNIPIDMPDKCWPWRGKAFRNGYGRFCINQTGIGAHVASYRTVHGDIPVGMFVMHKCNNKRYCNPRHLTLGSNSENQRHASGSGAWPTGATGVRGITYDAARNYWVASGYRNGKRRNLYTGPHKSKAVQARQDWERENIPSFQETCNED